MVGLLSHLVIAISVQASDNQTRKEYGNKQKRVAHKITFAFWVDLCVHYRPIHIFPFPTLLIFLQLMIVAGYSKMPNDPCNERHITPSLRQWE